MIKIEKLGKTYDRGRIHAHKVLHDVSFELPDRGFVCILGPSGCGKTSLLNAIGGLDRFDSGRVSTAEASTRGPLGRAYQAERNRCFGYIFQNYYLLMDHSVAYNIYLGLHSLDLSHREKMTRVREALRAVEMEDFFRRRVGELSGGQQQRVAIARALARRPRVIFADEPTGNLDEANTVNICTLLRRISKSALVVMVTHEENIAGFFADRIIRLEEGRVASDSSDFSRGKLSAGEGKSYYAGDYEESSLQDEGVKLRLLRQESAAPVELTVLALGDRIVIKLSDARSVSCGEGPEILEGKRPLLSLEELERGDDSPLFTPEPGRQKRAGHGLGPGMMLSEARSMLGGRGKKQLGLKIFLVLLTVLTLFTVSDYITLSTIDPEDFIVTDSHILELRVNQGTAMYGDGRAFTPVIEQYTDYLRASDIDARFVPHVSNTAEYSVDIFQQLDAITMKFGAFSYVPLEGLDQSTLILGRMPENYGEIVIDRWILERAMESDGIIQNSIGGLDYFLGKQLHYMRHEYEPTIVGICDSGEPSIYMHRAGLVTLGSGGAAVTPLSELQRLYPGQYDDVVLGQGECMVVVNNAGVIYRSAKGSKYAPFKNYLITEVIEAEVYGSIIVADEEIDNMLWTMYSDRFYLYCQDKAEAAAFLAEKGSEMEQEGYAIIEVTDRHSDSMEAYRTAAGLRADARRIVTLTIIALCAVMLWLLCRSRTHERIGMLSVYRLLGIPGRKILGIFALESILLSLAFALPAAAAVWLIINLGGLIPQLQLDMLLSASQAGICLGAITVFHLLVSLLPALRLLRLPPAVLAGKYDI